MEYNVGTKIDLTYLNDTPTGPSRASRDDYNLYETGTKLSFLKMACGMIIMDIMEPPIVLRINMV